jgi:hypothetical protein
MVNDYVEIRDGRIFNIGIDVDVYIEDLNENQIANTIINEVRSYFDVTTKQMNEDIYLGDLTEIINNVDGVVNVLNLKVFNKVGGQYSLNPVEQELVNESTGQIRLINNTIYSETDSMFEIKFPTKDIRVYLRKRNELGR